MELEDVKTLNLKVDDILVVRVPEKMSRDRIENMSRNISALLPSKNKVMVIDAGIELEVVDCEVDDGRTTKA